MSDHIWTINGFRVDAETMCRHLIRELARRDEQIAAVRALAGSVVRRWDLADRIIAALDGGAS